MINFHSGATCAAGHSLFVLQLAWVTILSYYGKLNAMAITQSVSAGCYCYPAAAIRDSKDHHLLSDKLDILCDFAFTYGQKTVR
jgi:hypothetical protein